MDDPNCFRYYCPITNGNVILEAYSFPTEADEMFLNLFYLVGFYALFRMLAVRPLRFLFRRATPRAIQLLKA